LDHGALPLPPLPPPPSVAAAAERGVNISTVPVAVIVSLLTEGVVGGGARIFTGDIEVSRLFMPLKQQAASKGVPWKQRIQCAVASGKGSEDMMNLSTTWSGGCNHSMHESSG
jgi:hypothetical protein